MLNKLTIIFLVVGILVAVLDVNFTAAVESNEDTQCDGGDCAVPEKQQPDSKPDAEINVSDENNDFSDDNEEEEDADVSDQRSKWFRRRYDSGQRSDDRVHDYRRRRHDSSYYNEEDEDDVSDQTFTYEGEKPENTGAVRKQSGNFRRGCVYRKRLRRGRIVRRVITYRWRERRVPCNNRKQTSQVEDNEDFIPCEWEWTECSVTCGGGVQTSDVIWKSDDDTDCDPPNSRECNLQPCE